MHRLFWLGFFIVVSNAALPAKARSQASAFSANDIADLIQGGIPDETIAVRALAHCISFRLTSEVAERFGSLGATNSLISALRKVCYESATDHVKKPKVVPAVTIKPSPSTSSKTRFYHYLVGMRSGLSAPMSEIPSALASGRYYAVDIDRAGRMVRRVTIQNGKPQADVRYLYSRSSKLPDSLVSYLPTGELSDVSIPVFAADGNMVSSRAVTPFGEVSTVAYSDSGNARVRVDSSSAGVSRTVTRYSPTGTIVATRLYLPNNKDYVDSEFDPATGLITGKLVVREGHEPTRTKYSRDSDGTLTREDFYYPGDVSVGSREYINGRATIEHYKWPSGETAEARPVYDSRDFETERTVFRNGTLVAKFVYDRYPNGRIKRTIAVAPDGQLLAEYPGVFIAAVRRDGHPTDYPTLGKVYKTTPWW